MNKIKSNRNKHKTCELPECGISKVCPMHSFLEKEFKNAFSRLEYLEKLMKVGSNNATKKGTASGRKIRIDENLILRIRTKYKMTQMEFSHLLGTNITSVNRWERGKTVPNKTMQQRILTVRSIGCRKARRILKEMLQEKCQ